MKVTEKEDAKKATEVAKDAKEPAKEVKEVKDADTLTFEGTFFLKYSSNSNTFLTLISLF
jgi:hypothetical protein